jgi:hypothetical protein
MTTTPSRDVTELMGPNGNEAVKEVIDKEQDNRKRTQALLRLMVSCSFTSKLTGNVAS